MPINALVRTTILIPLLIAAALAGSGCRGRNEFANRASINSTTGLSRQNPRRYAYIIRTAAEMKMAVLSDPAVRRHLGIEYRLLAALGGQKPIHLRHRLNEEISSIKAEVQAAELSPEERHTKIEAAIDRNLENELEEARGKSIQTEFHRVVMAVYGPRFLPEYSYIMKKHPLSKEQKDKIQNLVESHEQAIADDVRILGRYAVGGSASLHAYAGDSEKLVATAFSNLEAAERRLDNEIFDLLSIEQKKVWKEELANVNTIPISWTCESALTFGITLSLEEDLLNFTELAPFIYQLVRFRGLACDPVMDSFRFGYYSAAADQDSLWRWIDVSAKLFGWELVDNDRNQNKYSKRLPSRPHDVTVLIIYDGRHKTVEVQYSWF